MRGGKRENAGRKFLNPNEGKRQTHAITIPDSLWEELNEEANNNNLSVSQLIEKYCREGLKK